jgi:FMN-dependent NADH-azoreductase
MTFVDLDWIAGAFSPPGQRTPGHEHALKISDELIAELFAADVIVLGMPMYNFSVPAVVKAWIDHLVRGGKTFRYTPTGPVGLAGGRTAVIALCSGQAYSAASGNDACNFAVPYLRHIFSFMGITDVRILHAEGAGRVAQGQISAEEFLAPYLAQAAQLAV